MMAMSFVACDDGDGRTPFEVGETVSGTVTTSDSHWTSCESSEPDAYCNDGYSDKYEVEVTEGRTYTVTFADADEGIVFEDVEDGTVMGISGVSGPSMGADESPLKWTPSESGTNKVGIYALSDYVPADYEFVVTEDE